MYPVLYSDTYRVVFRRYYEAANPEHINQQMHVSPSNVCLSFLQSTQLNNRTGVWSKTMRACVLSMSPCEAEDCGILSVRWPVGERVKHVAPMWSIWGNIPTTSLSVCVHYGLVIFLACELNLHRWLPLWNLQILSSAYNKNLYDQRMTDLPGGHHYNNCKKLAC